MLLLGRALGRRSVTAAAAAAGRVRPPKIPPARALATQRGKNFWLSDKSVSARGGRPRWLFAPPDLRLPV
jgi:hypothetical protein